MKTKSLLMLAVLAILATVGFTSCDELAVEDNPMQSYLTMRTSDVTLTEGETYVRKAVAAGTAVIVYSSSDATIATVDQEGKVTANAAGTAVITAQTTGYNAEGKKIYLAEEKSYKVTVVSATVPATSLTLNKTMEVLVKNGDALTITATATPAEATLTWESSDEAVATVANGVVTPKSVGIVTITAKSGDVKATCEVLVGNPVDLGASAYEAKNYDILKGNMGANQLTIPNDIKVVFNGVQTTKQIICQGTATIILADGSENTVTVSTANKAGIKIGDGATTTLTINGETAGTGQLTAQGGQYGAGIGTDYVYDNILSGGNIVINGGTVTATGGENGAGIGTGRSETSPSGSSNNTCGNITINGGTVTATGGENAAGIGTGLSIKENASNGCGNITIGTGVISVTAKKSTSYPGGYSIGIGDAIFPGSTQTCGTITIGGVVKAPSDFTAATYTYEP